MFSLTSMLFLYIYIKHFRRITYLFIVIIISYKPLCAHQWEKNVFIYNVQLKIIHIYIGIFLINSDREEITIISSMNYNVNQYITTMKFYE